MWVQTEVEVGEVLEVEIQLCGGEGQRQSIGGPERHHHRGVAYLPPAKKWGYSIDCTRDGEVSRRRLQKREARHRHTQSGGIQASPAFSTSLQ